eukprot:g25160.t1
MPWTFVQVLARVLGRLRPSAKTGTSYLLVPAKDYLRIARSLVPKFDDFCGYDKDVGNVVVCDCEVKSTITGQVSIEIAGHDGDNWDLEINSNNLMQEAPIKKNSKHWMANNEEVCVLQVQQLPKRHTQKSAYGILGNPFEDKGRTPFGFLHPGPFPGALMGPLMLPLGPMMGPGGMPPPPPGGACFSLLHADAMLKTPHATVWRGANDLGWSEELGTKRKRRWTSPTCQCWPKLS